MPPLTSIAAPKRTSLLTTICSKNEANHSKNPIVALERLPIKKIIVTALSKGIREVNYVDEYSSDSDCSSDGEDYFDWRLQVVPCYKSRKRKRKGKRLPFQPKVKVLQIPRKYPSMFKVNYAQDDLHSILDVLGGGPMSTDILDGYLLRRLQLYREKIKPPLSPINFQYLSVCYAPVKDREQCPSSIETNPKWHPSNFSLSPLQQSTILIAPQYISKHFYMAVFFFPRKTVHVYDSSWHYLPMELRKGQIQAVLKGLSPSDYTSWKIDFKTKSSPQYDEYSCGSYAIFYGENVISSVNLVSIEKKNRKKLSKDDVINIRKKIVRELLLTTSNGRSFLEAITE